MKIEIRSANEAIIEGYVNAVERDSRLLHRSMCAGAKGSFYERVRAGVFQRALDSGKVVELRHNHGRVIGGTDSNLQLKEDNIGLHARAVITDPEIVAKAVAGELRGWSFGFNCVKDDWEDIGEGIQRRNLDEITVSEVSLLDSSRTPAYIGTSVEMRDEDCLVLEWRGAEETPEIENAIADEAEETGSGEEEQRSDCTAELNRKRLEVMKMRYKAD